MTTKSCAVTGCDREVRARGLCYSHCAKSCAVTGCDRKVRARGLCYSHWDWSRRHGWDNPTHTITPRPRGWPPERFPWEPLRDELNRQYGPTRSIAELARNVGGWNRSTFQKWARHGLTIWAADRIACQIGVHPFHIWGDEWWASDHTPTETAEETAA